MSAKSSECSLSITSVNADEELNLAHGKSALQDEIDIKGDNQNDHRSKIQPKDTDHYKIYEKIFEKFVEHLRFLGFVMSYSWAPRKEIFWWISCFIVIFGWVNTLYTQVLRFNDDDLLGVMQVVAVCGFASSVTMKILGMKKYAKDFLSLIFAMRKICLQNVVGSRADILTLNLNKTYTMLIMFIACGSSSCLLFFIAPLKEYIQNKILTAPVPIEIIFVDQSTNIGFAQANLAQATIGFQGTFTILLYGTLFIFIVFNYSTQVELMGQDFQDLDEMWTTANTISKRYKQEFLKNIYKKSQDLKNYMDVVYDIYQDKLFYYVCTNYLALIICFFEVKKHEWIPGYGLAIGILSEMMFYMLMGTKLSITNERLCDIIHNTKWYMYDLQSQKIVLMMLHRCQNFEELQLGPIGPLHILTFIEVVKSIYSYYTVLSELF